VSGWEDTIFSFRSFLSYSIHLCLIFFLFFHSSECNSNQVRKPPAGMKLYIIPYNNVIMINSFLITFFCLSLSLKVWRRDSHLLLWYIVLYMRHHAHVCLSMALLSVCNSICIEIISTRRVSSRARRCAHLRSTADVRPVNCSYPIACHCYYTTASTVNTSDQQLAQFFFFYRASTCIVHRAKFNTYYYSLCSAAVSLEN
jgi:hypothetical protein